MVRIGKGGSDFLHIYPLCDAVFFYVYHPSDFFFIFSVRSVKVFVIFQYVPPCTGNAACTETRSNQRWLNRPLPPRQQPLRNPAPESRHLPLPPPRLPLTLARSGWIGPSQMRGPSVAERIRGRPHRRVPMCPRHRVPPRSLVAGKVHSPRRTLPPVFVVNLGSLPTRAIPVQTTSP